MPPEHILPLQPPSDSQPSPGRQPADTGQSAPLQPLLLTEREAAKILAISQRTLWDLTDRGAVPCVRLGRSKRYAVAELRAYVELLRAGHPSPPREGG
jgi:excisionase family DNA binding protein